MSEERDEFPVIEMMPLNLDAADALAYMMEGVRREIVEAFGIPTRLLLQELSDPAPQDGLVFIGIDEVSDPVLSARVSLPVRR